MNAPAHPWLKSYPANVRWDVPIETTTLPALLDRAVRDYGERPALEYRGRRVSYLELGELADRAAAALLELSIRRDDAVALYLPNTHYHPICFFGALRAGARVVHLSPLDAERPDLQAAGQRRPHAGYHESVSSSADGTPATRAGAPGSVDHRR